ncbi:MAG: DUF1080 domain-containing protein [Pirellulaceae bacterium]|nr:DUF1080 domain-containing protein [Pirellulaceae bacterium]
MFRKPCAVVGCSVLLFCAFATSLVAADAQGQALFDGSDLSAWQSASGGAPSAGWVVEDGTLVRKEKANYIWTKERFADFCLELEFKTAGNSGIFFRTDNPGNPVQTGIEIQVDKPAAAPGKHSTGALYDLLAPTKVADRPAGEWNKISITAQDAKITVVLNGEKIIDADLNQWTEANQNPDGTRNKFNTALKDFKRDGHIGLQDHGADVSYRNIRIQRLP